MYSLLREHGVTQFAYVPDAGHRVLIDRSLADNEAHSVALTTEEEGVALLAGADLGGKRGVLLMQSSGVGNCINMLSLIDGADFRSCPWCRCAAISARESWQFPMGRAVQPVLEAMGVMCFAPTPRHDARGDGRRRRDDGVPGRARRRRAVHAALLGAKPF